MPCRSDSRSGKKSGSGASQAHGPMCGRSVGALERKRGPPRNPTMGASTLVHRIVKGKQEGDDPLAECTVEVGICL